MIPFMARIEFSKIISTIYTQISMRDIRIGYFFLGDFEKLIFSLMLLRVELIIGRRLIPRDKIIPEKKETKI
jgi:hypothetical protein